MFFDCPSVTTFQNHLTKILHMNYQATIHCKRNLCCMATSPSISLPNNSPRPPSVRHNKPRTAPTVTLSDQQCIFCISLQFRLYTEIHSILWANDMETFRGYWLHSNIIGKIHTERITLSHQVQRLPCTLSDYLLDAVHNLTVYNYWLYCKL